VEATLASESFVVRRLVEGDAEAARDMMVVYQAPDRARVAEGDGFTSIAVGRTMYSTHAQPGVGPDLFFRPSVPALADGVYAEWWKERSESPYVEDFFGEVRLLAEATTVVRRGSTYHYRIDGGAVAVSGDAHVESGRIRDFTGGMEGPGHGRHQVTVRISDYDHAPPVDPPQDDKIVDPPDLEPCGDDGAPPPGHQVCGDNQVIRGFAGMPDLEPCDAAGAPPPGHRICGKGHEIEGVAGVPNTLRPEAIDQTIVDLLEPPPVQRAS
jgi:hypothetical protein